jgi:hypothetical protein
MKKVSYFLSALAIMAFVACNGEEEKGAETTTPPPVDAPNDTLTQVVDDTTMQASNDTIQ